MKKIATKIFLATISASIAVGVVCLIANIVILSNVSTECINTAERTLREDYDKVIKSEVETVMSILDKYNKLYENGTFSKEEAQKNAADLIRDLRYDNNNYFWIDTSKGFNIALYGSSSEGTNRYTLKDSKGAPLIKGIIDAALTGDGYYNYYFPRVGGTSEPLPKRSFSAYFKPFDWVIGTGNYIDDIDDIVNAKKTAAEKVMRDSIIIIVIILVIIIALAALLAAVLGLRIAKPIRKVSSVLEELASGEGDLTGRLPVLSDDEVGVLSTNYNTFLDRLTKIVRSINETMTKAVNLKEVMNNATQEALSALHQISTNSSSMNQQMKVLDDATEHAAGAVGKINESILSLDSSIENQSSAVEEASASVNQMVSSLKTVSDITEEKDRVTRHLVETSEDGKRNVEDTRSVIRDISSSIGTINEMVSVINSIASQTNLLAMNAAIESAHAGEAGKGFSVVATEIRKLAETSSKNAKDISSRLKEILENIDQADSASNRSLEVIEEVNSEVQETAKSFGEILAHAQELSHGGEQILIAMTSLSDISVRVKDDSSQMKLESEKMGKVVEGVTSISGEVATGMDEISTGSHEITESMASMHNNMEILSDITDKLQNEVRRFKIGESDTKEDPSTTTES